MEQGGRWAFPVLTFWRIRILVEIAGMGWCKVYSSFQDGGVLFLNVKTCDGWRKAVVNAAFVVDRIIP